MPLGMTNVTKELGHNNSGSAHVGDSQDEAVVGYIKDRFFTSDFVLVTLVNFVNPLGLQMLTVTLPVYAISLGGSQAEAGL
jgi:hypothetical protein